MLKFTSDDNKSKHELVNATVLNIKITRSINFRVKSLQFCKQFVN